MVQEGVVLHHVVSQRGIEVDRAKIEVIEHLRCPTCVKGVQSILEHASFYRRFIKDFSKTTKPLTLVLAKDTLFIFSNECLEAFYKIKESLIATPIIQPPDWSLPFQIMCDASDSAVGVILGQRRDKKSYFIWYACKALNEAQQNYTTTEKELHWMYMQLRNFVLTSCAPS